jgi:ABC-2 type transport system ATP-binding protein
MPAALATRGLTKSYGSLTAVEPLDIELEPGVVLGFLGPNGAGKTTLIRMVTTVIPPTAGSFEVAGISDNRPEEIRRRIGALPESAGYPDGQTGEEFLRYHARLYGRSRAHARTTADRLLEEVRLDDRGGSLVSTYSRGMRQRLGIARALVNDPQVVFLDEPTLGLDPAGQRQVLALVARIARERGATVVLSTHLLAEVEEICDRVLIIHRGRVVVHGTVADVAARAAAPRTAQVRVPAEFGDRAREALAAADVPVIDLEVERGRLSDAFLEMTETS